MFAVDLVDPAPGSRARRWPAASRAAKERGLPDRKGGLLQPLRMAPPLTLSEAEAKEGLQILTDSLTASTRRPTAM